MQSVAILYGHFIVRHSHLTVQSLSVNWILTAYFMEEKKKRSA
jgi:hypothetical protein